MKKYLATIFSILVFLAPSFAFAGQISAVDFFDTYSDGNLSTNNGGSGWAAAWTSVQGDGTIQGTTFLSTPKAVQFSPAAAEPQVKRQFTAALTGTSNLVSFAIRFDSVAAGRQCNVFITKTSQAAGTFSDGYVSFELTSSVFQLGARTQGAVTLLSSPSANTWYYVYLDIDATNSKIRGAVTTSPTSAPTFSSYTGASSPAITDAINYWQFYISGSADTGKCFFDNIGDNPGVASFHIIPMEF